MCECVSGAGAVRSCIAGLFLYDLAEDAIAKGGDVVVEDGEVVEGSLRYVEFFKVEEECSSEGVVGVEDGEASSGSTETETGRIFIVRLLSCCPDV